MRYQFDHFTLDTDRGNLIGPDGEIMLEPKAWAVLNQLIENRGAVLSKDELIDTCWDGRIVSDAAISTAIKAIRRALGDDGKRQSRVRTIRRRGFRFDAEVRLSAAAEVPRILGTEGDKPSGKPKIAVLPFVVIGAGSQVSVLGQAIAAELISALSKFRWLSVIAQASSFRFREGMAEGAAIRELLGAGYMVTGTVEISPDRLTVSAGLSDSREAVVLWSERFEARMDDVHDLRAQIVASVVSAMSVHISENEARNAQFVSSEHLDAWSAYHLGVHHLNRYSKTSNAHAKEYFQTATRLDPNFASAYAAWALARFQDAFQRLDPDRATVIEDTQRLSERAVELDPHDPFAHFAFGRAHWLAGRAREGLRWMDSSIELNPNFAIGFYSRGFLNLHSGTGVSSEADVAEALRLSPVDPLAYGMHATYALAMLQSGDLASALDWAERSASAINAHHLVILLAAAIAELAGDRSTAEYWKDRALAKRSDANIAGLLEALPMGGGELANEVSGALGRIGLS